MKFGVNYYGLLRSPMSWAKIGREIIKAFLSKGDDVSVYERKGFGYNRNFELESDIENNITNSFRHDITLSFEYPLNYSHITSKVKAGMLCYETTKIPKDWVKYINSELDHLFLPDEFNKKIFVDCGVEKDIIRIAPYGINPKYYHRENVFGDSQIAKGEQHAQKLFRFLCISMPQKRKGVDVLIQAFEKVFGGNKDVELILKFPYMPGKSKYDIDNLKLETRNKKLFKIITDEYSETQMGELYRSADCFVLPSRAEGFGMGYIEALACGLPVIATNWGAHTCFLNNNNSLLVDYTIRKAGEIQYDNFDPDAELAEPDFDDLCDKLLYMYEHFEDEQKKVKLFNLEPYMWNYIAERMKMSL